MPVRDLARASLAAAVAASVAACSTVPGPQGTSKNSLSVAGPTIDTLSYFVTQHPERALEGAGGQRINQVVDEAERRVYLMKWGPRSFIGYSWDDEYIYFLEEHEMDFEGATSDRINYSFAPGYWFRRQMDLGEALDGTQGGDFVTTMTVYDTPHTCNVARTQQYFMKTVLEAHDPAANLGGDLGVQDVIVLRLEQGSFSEKEIYAKGWGLVGWKECSLDGSVCHKEVWFNRFSAEPPRAVERAAACLPGFRSPPISSAGGCINRQLTKPFEATVPAGVDPTIKRMYDELLGFVGEFVEGARYLTGVHASGTSYESIRMWLIDQPEIRAQASAVYQAYVKRPVTDLEWGSIRGAYRAGGTIQDVERGIAASPECKP